MKNFAFRTHSRLKQNETEVFVNDNCWLILKGEYSFGVYEENTFKVIFDYGHDNSIIQTIDEVQMYSPNCIKMFPILHSQPTHAWNSMALENYYYYYYYYESYIYFNGAKM